MIPQGVWQRYELTLLSAVKTCFPPTFFFHCYLGPDAKPVRVKGETPIFFNGFWIRLLRKILLDLALITSLYRKTRPLVQCTRRIKPVYRITHHLVKCTPCTSYGLCPGHSQLTLEGEIITQYHFTVAYYFSFHATFFFDISNSLHLCR